MSFSSRDDVGIGTSLAAVAAPFLSELSLLTECHRLTGRALAALGDADRGTRREMELQASLGSSLIHGVGLGLKGALAIHYGEAEAGVQLLHLAGRSSRGLPPNARMSIVQLVAISPQRINGVTQQLNASLGFTVNGSPVRPSGQGRPHVLAMIPAKLEAPFLAACHGQRSPSAASALPVRRWHSVSNDKLG